MTCCKSKTGLAWGTDEGAIRDAFSSFGVLTEGNIVISLDLSISKEVVGHRSVQGVDHFFVVGDFIAVLVMPKPLKLIAMVFLETLQTRKPINLGCLFLMSAMLMISSSAMVLLRYITKLLPHIISYGFFPSFVLELYCLLLFSAPTAIRSWDSMGFFIRSFLFLKKTYQQQI